MADYKIVNPECQLKELWELYQGNEGSNDVRRLLTRGLSESRLIAFLEKDLSLMDETFDDLRALHRAHPKDSYVRDKLAGVIYEKMRLERGDAEPAFLEALQDGLKSLYHEDETHSEVIGYLAEGLSTTRRFARGRDYDVQGGDLMRELRAMYHCHHDRSHTSFSRNQKIQSIG